MVNRTASNGEAYTLTAIGDGLYRCHWLTAPYADTAVYYCPCGRQQTARHPDFLGGNKGVRPQVVERFGWRKIEGRWRCPFCTGNTAKLRAFCGAKE